MDRIDEFELEVLDHSGDFELAQKTGAVVRWCMDVFAEGCADLLGVPVEVLRARAIEAWWNE